jgi:hypothetical protein
MMAAFTVYVKEEPRAPTRTTDEEIAAAATNKEFDVHDEKEDDTPTTKNMSAKRNKRVLVKKEWPTASEEEGEEKEGKEGPVVVAKGEAVDMLKQVRIGLTAPAGPVELDIDDRFNCSGGTGGCPEMRHIPIQNLQHFRIRNPPVKLVSQTIKGCRLLPSPTDPLSVIMVPSPQQADSETWTMTLRGNSPRDQDAATRCLRFTPTTRPPMLALDSRDSSVVFRAQVGRPFAPRLHKCAGIHVLFTLHDSADRLVGTSEVFQLVSKNNCTRSVDPAEKRASLIVRRLLWQMKMVRVRCSRDALPLGEMKVEIKREDPQDTW